MNNKPIFIYEAPLSFAWCGGRLLIMNGRLELIDFGDGFMSRGKFGHHSGVFTHDILGKMQADDTVFQFFDYNITFDFNSLRNCGFFNRNKWYNRKLKYYIPATYHMDRFHKKRLNYGKERN